MLTISTTLIEDGVLSWVNIVGMVLCVMGIAIHTTLKAWWARREYMYIHTYIYT